MLDTKQYVNVQLSSKLLLDLAKPVAIVAHDAGAANHLAEWIGTIPLNGFSADFEGPARAIFAERCPWLKPEDSKIFLPQCQTLVSGTGWSSSLEHEARRIAKSVGCHCIAVIDHWTDYRQRFSRQGLEVLPDEIWVADDCAARLARAEFPDMPVHQLQNVYLERLAGEIRGKSSSIAGAHSDNILYVLEPIRDDWGHLALPGEFLALDFFAHSLGALGVADTAKICLRPHPSDPMGKYDSWIEAQTALNVSLDKSASLADALAWADVVVGCQTYAMVVALAAGKRVVCSIPPGMPNCVLPHNEINHLARLVS